MAESEAGSRKSESRSQKPEGGGRKSGCLHSGFLLLASGFISDSESGQTLVETALLLPLLLMIIFNVVNFGYFVLVALNLTAAPRSGVEYSIMGYATPGTLAEPSATSVSSLAQSDLTGSLASGASAPVQVCSKAVGLNSAGTASQTASCTPTSTYSPAADPESPSFVLQRVDITYTFIPLIPGTPFNIALLPSSLCTSPGVTMTCTFHRQVSMRAMD